MSLWRWTTRTETTERNIITTSSNFIEIVTFYGFWFFYRYIFLVSSTTRFINYVTVVTHICFFSIFRGDFFSVFFFKSFGFLKKKEKTIKCLQCSPSSLVALIGNKLNDVIDSFSYRLCLYMCVFMCVCVFFQLELSDLDFRLQPKATK